MTRFSLTADSPSRLVFAARVREERLRQDLLQEELDHKAGFRRGRTSEVEAARHAANLDTVDQFAKALGVTAAQLLTWSGQ